MAIELRTMLKFIVEKTEEITNLDYEEFHDYIEDITEWTSEIAWLIQKYCIENDMKLHEHDDSGSGEGKNQEKEMWPRTIKEFPGTYHCIVNSCDVCRKSWITLVEGRLIVSGVGTEVIRVCNNCWPEYEAMQEKSVVQ